MGRLAALAALLIVLMPLTSASVAAVHATSGFTITLTPSQPSGVAAGTPISWTASSTDPSPVVYQFSTSAPDGTLTMVRDFSPKNSFLWTPPVEGQYTVTVVVKENLSSTVPNGVGYGEGPTSSLSVPYTAVVPTTTVNAASNPLVAEYHAPACPSGDMVTVEFRQAGTARWTVTPLRNCTPSHTALFYVAGMLPVTTYQMRHAVLSEPGNVLVSAGAIQNFTTGALPTSLVFPATTIITPAQSTSAMTDSIIDYEYAVASTSPNEVVPLATNLAGHVIWYGYQADLTSTWGLRDAEGGYEFLAGNDGAQPQTGGLNVLREINRGGAILHETNIGAINDQLLSNPKFAGVHLINGFHHDALPLPNGDLAVLSFTSVYSPTINTWILGDNVLVLDQNFQVAWVWDSFNKLPYRSPTLNDVCGAQNPFLCPGATGQLPANTIDWLHSNALTWSSLDNNIVLSMRSQDWAIKLNYNNGTGDGSVLWRMGLGGDFSIVPAIPGDPYPWFSHQHNVNYLDSTTLAMFDNGNTRCNGAVAGTCDSRGQEYIVNEATKVVTQTLNVDLGAYSPALGTAQRLSNGNFNFVLGFLGTPPNNFGQAVEVQRNGTKVFVSQLGQAVYRAWRLTTMYSMANLSCPTCTSGY